MGRILSILLFTVLITACAEEPVNKSNSETYFKSIVEYYGKQNSKPSFEERVPKQKLCDELALSTYGEDDILTVSEHRYSAVIDRCLRKSRTLSADDSGMFMTIRILDAETNRSLFFFTLTSLKKDSSLNGCYLIVNEKQLYEYKEAVSCDSAAELSSWGDIWEKL